MKLKQFSAAIISFLLLQGGFSQSAEQTYAFARKQLEAGEFHSAISTYHRVQFFDNGQNRAATFQDLGDCYFNTGEYVEAARQFGLAFFLEKNDSVRTELILKSAQSYLLLNDFNAALTELLSISENQSRFFEKRKDFYLAICYWGLNDYYLSEKYFLACVVNEDPASFMEINEQFAAVKKIRIHPKTAKILSVFFPGAGQLYCGDLKNAANSFIISVALFALCLHVIRVYSYLDAFLAVFPWFQRYYFGGIKNAGLIANRRIIEKKRIIYLKILNAVALAKGHGN